MIRETEYPAVIDGNVRNRQRTHDVIAVHNPMSAGTAPMGRGCVMVDAVDGLWAPECVWETDLHSGHHS
jgi:hypothetical protein